MTPEDQEEWNYRYHERLGILNPNHDPNLEANARALAETEANHWVTLKSMARTGEAWICPQCGDINGNYITICSKCKYRLE